MCRLVHYNKSIVSKRYLDLTALAATRISRTATLRAAKLLLDSEAMLMVGRAVLSIHSDALDRK